LGMTSVFSNDHTSVIGSQILEVGAIEVSGVNCSGQEGGSAYGILLKAELKVAHLFAIKHSGLAVREAIVELNRDPAQRSSHRWRHLLTSGSCAQLRDNRSIALIAEARKTAANRERI
jgi:hypothetical protein